MDREYEPVAFVDDDPRKKGKEVHGIRVAGGCDQIPDITSGEGIDIILIATPTAMSEQMRRIVGICEKTGIAFRTLPRLQALVNGQASVKELRDVKIDDLLGREAVSLDWKTIARGMTGKSILVSGGGGSIGSELCHQIAGLQPSRLIILERSEFNLYSVELELRRAFPELPLLSVLGDAGDAAAGTEIMRKYQPDLIFHAAAYKHVPMLEGQVRSAVINNVLATRTLARLADEYGCESFVLVSTDKAVNPGNIMGASKRVAEIYCQDLNDRSATRFITVRFGNVLGSAGSVIPLFQKQIATGGPVTVTHPKMTRYFMTIAEAAQLILQASVLGQGGEIFVLDMGEPVRIAYLAEQLILLSGKKPGDDIEIVFTGLRAGEKLYEELFHDAEKLAETTHPKIMLARSRKVEGDALERDLDSLAQACKMNDEPGIRQDLRRLVPEHRAPASERAPANQAGAVVYPWNGPHGR